MSLEGLQTPLLKKQQNVYLNAAKYSASAMGGSSPPVKATFTLKPSPAPLPTWKAENPSLIQVSTGGFGGELKRSCSDLIRSSTAWEEVSVVIAMQR